MSAKKCLVILMAAVSFICLMMLVGFIMIGDLVNTMFWVGALFYLWFGFFLGYNGRQQIEEEIRWAEEDAEE